MISPADTEHRSSGTRNPTKTLEKATAVSYHICLASMVSNEVLRQNACNCWGLQKGFGRVDWRSEPKIISIGDNIGIMENKMETTSYYSI